MHQTRIINCNQRTGRARRVAVRKWKNIFEECVDGLSDQNFNVFGSSFQMLSAATEKHINFVNIWFSTGNGKITCVHVLCRTKYRTQTVRLGHIRQGLHGEDQTGFRRLICQINQRIKNETVAFSQVSITLMQVSGDRDTTYSETH